MSSAYRLRTIDRADSRYSSLWKLQPQGNGSNLRDIYLSELQPELRASETQLSVVKRAPDGRGLPRVSAAQAPDIVSLGCDT